jgi:hypothetical protein
VHSKEYLKYLSCSFWIGYLHFSVGTEECHEIRLSQQPNSNLRFTHETPRLRSSDTHSTMQFITSDPAITWDVPFTCILVYLTKFSLISYTVWYLFTLFDGVARKKNPNWVVTIVAINGKNDGGGKSYDNWWYTLDMNLKFCFPPFLAPIQPQTRLGHFHSVVLLSFR